MTGTGNNSEAPPNRGMQDGADRLILTDKRKSTTPEIDLTEADELEGLDYWGMLSGVAPIFSDSPVTSAIANYIAYVREPFEPLKVVSSAIQQMVSSFALDLDAFFRGIDALYEGIDWEAYRQAARIWGEFGWVIPDEMFLSDSLIVPHCLSEANSICRRLFHKQELDSMFQELTGAVRKKRDLEEAIWLFEKRHYKPCAMMVCSLIDNELISMERIPIRSKPDRERRSGRKTLRTIHGSLPEEGLLAIRVENIISAYGCFTRNGKDFNRAFEGELNRNFLMHGMMYKRVTRTVCVKLFCLLYAVSSDLPHYKAKH